MKVGIKPTMYIAGKPYYINFVGVDRATRSIVIEKTEAPDMTNAQRRIDDFAKSFGFVRAQSESTIAQH